jgi:hypothetical protein
MNSPSPILSPVDEPNAAPIQPLSKRDKRRTALIDRFNDLQSQFSANRDIYYREQLSAIQQDVALILHTNPYVNNPDQEPTQAMIDVMSKLTRGDPRVIEAIQNGDIKSIGGKVYHEFLDDIEDACERRDAALTHHKVCTASPQFQWCVAQY